MLHEMAREEGDEAQEPEIEAATARASTAKLDELELRSLFTGEHDEADAICAVNAKDGGVDAQDWAEMLLRMYSRWAERARASTSRSTTSRRAPKPASCRPSSRSRAATPTGSWPRERGMHRLVRISPFDGNARRQTSFAAVEVWPVHRRRRARSRSTTRTSASTPTALRAPVAST